MLLELHGEISRLNSWIPFSRCCMSTGVQHGHAYTLKPRKGDESVDEFSASANRSKHNGVKKRFGNDVVHAEQQREEMQ